MPYVYLHLAWLKIRSVRLENIIKPVWNKRFNFTSRPLLPAIEKNVLPASLLSNVVYNFSCHCDSRYVGRTS